jgi:hypothetical protein
MGSNKFAPLKRMPTASEEQIRKANEDNSSTHPNNSTSRRDVKITTNWQTCEPTPAFNRLMSLLLGGKNNDCN